MVDDGSTDGSEGICDDYARKDSRIKVIHKKNAGLSAARNSGIDNAQGDYLAFIDSDDYIDSRMVEMLFQAITKSESDLALCNFEYVDESRKRIVKFQSPILDEVLSSDNAMKKLFGENNWYYIVAWNKLYKKELWEDYRYPVGYIHEDEATIHRILARCNKVICINKNLYFYRQVFGSITNSGFNVRHLDIYSALSDRIIFLANQTEKELLIKLCYQYWYSYMRDYFKYYSNGNNSKYIKRMKKSLFKAIPTMYKLEFFSKKDVLGLCLFFINPNFYKKLFMK